MEPEQQERSPYVSEFNARTTPNEQAQQQLEREHQKSPFAQWNGLLVIRFSDGTTMQTNWTKLASALEKMRRDGTTVAAMMQLTASDDRQESQTIGGGLIPFTDRVEFYVRCEQTRMMSEQNGRVGARLK
jgi:hypothetical protein